MRMPDAWHLPFLPCEPDNKTGASFLAVSGEVPSIVLSTPCPADARSIGAITPSAAQPLRCRELIVWLRSASPFRVGRQSHLAAGASHEWRTRIRIPTQLPKWLLWRPQGRVRGGSDRAVRKQQKAQMSMTRSRQRQSTGAERGRSFDNTAAAHPMAHVPELELRREDASHGDCPSAMPAAKAEQRAGTAFPLLRIATRRGRLRRLRFWWHQWRWRQRDWRFMWRRWWAPKAWRRQERWCRRQDEQRRRRRWWRHWWSEW
jgi:hypothetical protein